MSQKLKENAQAVNTQLLNAELVSALVDGQLQGDEIDCALDYLGESMYARQEWDTYQLLGDVMRSSAVPLRAHDPLFIENLRKKMAPLSLNLIADDALSIRPEAEKMYQKPAANDVWWQRLAGFASVAILAVLVWQGVAFLGQGDATPMLARASEGSSHIMIRDPQLDALLAAHRQLGGANALQMPAGFLRNATFNEGSR
jgi:sigma-E factor negative regulatory protein RseA